MPQTELIGMATAPTDIAIEMEAKRKIRPTMVTVKLLYRTLPFKYDIQLADSYSPQKDWAKVLIALTLRGPGVASTYSRVTNLLFLTASSPENAGLEIIKSRFSSAVTFRS